MIPGHAHTRITGISIGFFHNAREKREESREIQADFLCSVQTLILYQEKGASLTNNSMHPYTCVTLVETALCVISPDCLSMLCMCIEAEHAQKTLPDSGSEECNQNGFFGRFAFPMLISGLLLGKFSAPAIDDNFSYSLFLDIVVWRK